jgi:N-dimethylarginine dimethylaminohydrolase
VAINFGGHSMVSKLRRVMICDPAIAGWKQPQRWRELGYLHAPDFSLATQQHTAMRRELASAGAEIVTLDPVDGFSLDAVYVHDASFMTDFGAVCLAMGKPSRSGEPGRHHEQYQRLGIPLLGEIQPPGTAEAGDMVWLDQHSVLVGRGYRTNAAGIEQLSALLSSHGIEVLSAPLPHSSGPGCCLHLMSLMSLLDEQTALVDLSWLAVETIELLRLRGFNLIEIDATERDSLACNVLALGERRLLALEENRRTNQRLTAAAFQVQTFPGSEIGINGGGGPTCLTRPLWRI